MKTARNIFYLILLVTLCNFSTALAQSEKTTRQKMADVKKELPTKDKDKLKKAGETVKKAMKPYKLYLNYDKERVKNEKSADKASKKKKKKYQKKAVKAQKNAVKQCAKAAKLFKEGYKATFDILNANYAKIKPKANPANIDKGEELEEEAKSHYKQAKSKREQVSQAKDKISVYNDARSLEEEAISVQLNAYMVYLDPNPIEIYEEEVVVEEKAEVVVETKIVEEVKKTKPLVKIIFRVQILAMQESESIQDLNTRYKIDDTIDHYIDNGWHKYTIGKYTNYEDAKNRKELLYGVKEPFVVAFRNGIEIPIEKALELTNN